MPKKSKTHRPDFNESAAATVAETTGEGLPTGVVARILALQRAAKKSGADLLRPVAKGKPDAAVIADIKLPSASGMEILKPVKKREPAKVRK